MDSYEVLEKSVHEPGVKSVAANLGEAEKIRIEWENLQSSAEGFAAACEQGLYTD